MAKDTNGFGFLLALLGWRLDSIVKSRLGNEGIIVVGAKSLGTGQRTSDGMRLRNTVLLKLVRRNHMPSLPKSEP